MTGLLMKLVICPTVLVLSDYLLDGIFYPYIYQPLVVGVVLAVVSHLMEVLILRDGTFWISNMVDFATAFAIVYFSSLVLVGTRVTVLDTFSIAFVLMITEYFQHLWLLRSGKARKSE